MKYLTIYLVLLVNILCYSQTNVSQGQSNPPTLEGIQKQVDDLLLQNANNSSNINTLLAGKDIDAANKYNIIKQNLTAGVTSFQLLNTKINTLKAKKSADQLQLFIEDLNNPESNALGFKLSDQIKKLITEKVKPTKKNVADKIFDAVTNISNSPIVKNIPTMSSALSVANSVLGLLRSTAVVSDKVDQQKINDFELALNNYVQYYATLNDGRLAHAYNLESHEQSLQILQQRLYDQLFYLTKTLGIEFPTKEPNANLGDVMNENFLNFNRTYVDKMFSTLEKNFTSGGKINYEGILTSNNGNLKDANNRLEEFIELINQFEFLYTNYFTISNNYNEQIITALEVAKTNGITDPRTIKSKIDDFNDLKTKATNDMKTALNLPELLGCKQAIKYTARIL